MMIVLGWFPFLFYSTTWVGETYFRYQNPESATQSTDTLGDVGLSLVIFSSITLLSSVFLPFGIRSPDNRKPGFTPRPPPGLAALLKKIKAVRPDLQTAWFIAHFMFAATMIFAPLARSVGVATFLVAMCGVPWAISSWAPFAFMGVEINKLAMEKPSDPAPSASMITSTSFITHGYRPIDSVDTDVELDVLHLNHRSPEDSDDESETEASSTGELAGIYLGVLNVYTTLPQFVGTFISWLVFSILEPDATAQVVEGEKAGSEGARESNWMNTDADGPNAIAVCLFIGSLSALVAAEATRRFRALR
jgi:solute carrier family 45 protein 1/2/4